MSKLVKNVSDFPTKQDWVESSLVRISFEKEEDFLKIKETLTRIGVQPKSSENVLYQSCHILHKKLVHDDVYTSAYFLVHFKELFVLDGKQSTLTDEDVARRNCIAKILEEWKLLKIINPSAVDSQDVPNPRIKIIKHTEKNKWQLKTKYTIGNKK